MSKVLRNLTPNTHLNFATSNATKTDGAGASATAWQHFWKLVVPEGEVIGLPRFPLIVAKLMSDDAAAQVSRYAQLSIGLITPSDPARVHSLGSMPFSYTDYYDQALSEQRETRFKENFIQELARESCPTVVFNENETIVFSLLDDALTIDVSESVIEVPCYRGRPGSINQELTWRRLELGI